jgi:hypothetical protein
MSAATLDHTVQPARRSGEVSLVRLYVLRATYLLILAAMGSDVWPLLLHHRPWEMMHGVAVSMLAGVTLMALIGLRHPLKMLPLLFFEVTWKSIWLIALALPIWRSGAAIDAGTAATLKACVLGLIVFPAAIPWPYVFRHYVMGAAERWR